jgi:hypothetical protein
MIALDGSEGTNYKRPGTTKELRIGTWNVLNLYKAGALRNLDKVLQEYKVDITALQEICWIGQGTVERRDRNIYNSCRKK